MDRLTRHELKSDHFVEEVGHYVEYVDEHRQSLIRWGAIGLAVILVGGGIFWYLQHQREARMEALTQALKVYNAPVAVTDKPGALTYPTQDAKDAAVAKSFGDVMLKYSGSNEAAVASYMSALNAADKGKMADAERYLKRAIDDGNKDTSSLAKLSLAQVYAAEGKNADGEKLLRDLIDHPTIMVSKEQATITLARLIGRTNPEAGKKLVEGLRGQSGATGRQAIAVYGELSQPQSK